LNYKRNDAANYFSNYLFTYVLNEVDINNVKKYKIYNETVNIVNPLESNKNINKKDNEVRLIVSTFQINLFAKKMFGLNIRKVIFIQCIKDNELNELLLQIRDNATQEKINSIVSRIIKLLLNNYIANIVYGSDIIENCYVCKKVKAYTLNNYEFKISLDDLSKYINTCKYQIRRKLLLNLLITPMKFVYFLKTEIAKEMILSNQYTLSEIAIRSGFSDQSNMIKNFKKFYNLTPTMIKNKKVFFFSLSNS